MESIDGQNVPVRTDPRKFPPENPSGGNFFYLHFV
jgi:hypothetical protein